MVNVLYNIKFYFFRDVDVIQLPIFFIYVRKNFKIEEIFFSEKLYCIIYELKMTCGKIKTHTTIYSKQIK